MNQRIHNLTKWRFVPEGSGLHFFNDRIRTVVLEVNCPEEVRFYAKQDLWDLEDDPEAEADRDAGRDRPELEELAFIGVCKGRDRLEFGVEGEFDLIVEGGGAYVYAFDGQDIATRVVAPVIFTRLANRKQRNPHLEMIEYQMKLNQRRMMADLETEQELRIEAIKHELASYLPDRNVAAPAHLVGKAEGNDGLAEGEAEAVVEDAEPAAAAAKRKRKAKEPDDDE